MGDSDNSVKQERRTVFVTVGTTLFDALVRAVDTKEVKQQLLRRGYTHLIIQMGRGSYTPTKVFSNFAYLLNSFSFYSSLLFLVLIICKALGYFLAGQQSFQEMFFVYTLLDCCI